MISSQIVHFPQLLKFLGFCRTQNLKKNAVKWLSCFLILHELQLPGIHAEPSCCDIVYDIVVSALASCI